MTLADLIRARNEAREAFEKAGWDSRDLDELAIRAAVADCRVVKAMLADSRWVVRFGNTVYIRWEDKSLGDFNFDNLRDAATIEVPSED